MSTAVADGDRFRDPASFDGLPPLAHPDVVVRRSVLVRKEGVQGANGLPAFEDLSNAYFRLSSARWTDAVVPARGVEIRLEIQCQ